ncbi:tocopherol phytyltransferase [Nannochloropsis oceanica]
MRLTSVRGIYFPSVRGRPARDTTKLFRSHLDNIEDSMAVTTAGTAPPSSSSSRLTRLRHTLLVLWKFTRPHTFIGTALCVPTLHLFAAPAGLTLSQILTPRLLGSILWALLPAGLINVYITGLNQITDVSIDKINKPSLPLASGQLAPLLATLTVGLSLLLGLGLGLLRGSPFFSPSLLLTLFLSAALGTAYSLPPLRLKRFPLLAALSIIAVRGTIINLGFYTHALAVAFPPSLPSPLPSTSTTTLPVLSSLRTILGPILPSLPPFLSSLRAAMQPILSALSSLLPSLPSFLAPDLKIGLASAFFMVFGMVIALMKDVPDIEGDRQNRIYSFSVRQGATRVFGLALRITQILLVLTGGICVLAAVNAALVAGGGAAEAAAAAGAGAGVGAGVGRVVAALKSASLGGRGGRVGGRAVVAVLAWGAAMAVGRKGGKVNVEGGGGKGGEGGEVYRFYMFLWKLFYLSYALLPLAR